MEWILERDPGEHESKHETIQENFPELERRALPGWKEDGVAVSVGTRKKEQTLSNKLSQTLTRKKTAYGFFSKQNYQLSRRIC